MHQLTVSWNFCTAGAGSSGTTGGRGSPATLVVIFKSPGLYHSEALAEMRRYIDTRLVTQTVSAGADGLTDDQKQEIRKAASKLNFVDVSANGVESGAIDAAAR